MPKATKKATPRSKAAAPAVDLETTPRPYDPSDERDNAVAPVEE